MITIRNHTFSVDESLNKSAEIFSIEALKDSTISRKKVIGIEKVKGERVDISEAEIVVAAGRGIDKRARKF